jgi:hypothetical protein
MDYSATCPAPRKPWLLPAAVAVGIAIAVILGLLFTETTVCPGCNLPQHVSIDHYVIQNNTSQMPSLLTVWFRGYGSSDQSLNLKTIYLKDITPDCSSSSLNPQTLPTDPSQHPFQVSGVLTDSSILPVSIDTSTSSFYFIRNHCYQLTLVADKLIAGLMIRYS